MERVAPAIGLGSESMKALAAAGMRQAEFASQPRLGGLLKLARLVSRRRQSLSRSLAAKYGLLHLLLVEVLPLRGPSEGQQLSRLGQAPLLGEHLHVAPFAGLSGNVGILVEGLIRVADAVLEVVALRRVE